MWEWVVFVEEGKWMVPKETGKKFQGPLIDKFDNLLIDRWCFAPDFC